MAEPSAPQHEPAKLGRNLSFHFLWTSTFASGFADRLAMLAVGVMLGQGVKDEVLNQIRLGDAAIVAGISFWFFLPYVIWGPFAGWLADKLPRKWLMFIADQMRGLLILGAYLLIPPGSQGAIDGLYKTWFTIGGVEFTHAWKIWGMMFSIGLFAATFSPAKNSVIPNVVGYKSLQRANAIVVGMGVIGNLFGFAVGGVLAEKVLSICILTSSISYLGPGWMWPFLKTPVRRHDRPGLGNSKGGPLSVFVEVGKGGRYILKHRPLLVLTGVGILFWSGAQIIISSGSAIAVDLYGGDVKEFAYIGGCFGLGMLLGAVFLGWVNARHGGEIFIVIGMIGAAIFLSLLAVVPSLYIGMALALGCGFFGGFIMITTNTMVQQMTADGFRGRVMGFKDLAGDLGSVTVAFVIWRMPNADQTILSIAHAFSVLLVIAAVYGFFRYIGRRPTNSIALNVIWRITRIYVAAMHRLKITGRHYIPPTGPVLLISNHTCGIDPLLIQSVVQRPIRFMMASDYRLRALGWFWRLMKPIMVNRDGADRAALRQAFAALEDDQPIGIFPEGGYHYGIDEVTEFQSGIALLAKRSGVIIVPMHISGTARTKKVTTAFLRPSRAHLVVGKPITYDDLLDHADPGDPGDSADPATNSNQQIAQRLRQHVLNLAPRDESTRQDG